MAKQHQNLPHFKYIGNQKHSNQMKKKAIHYNAKYKRGKTGTNELRSWFGTFSTSLNCK